MNSRAYKRCPDGDRPAEEPGGMECEDCQCIFIGEEWHARCAVCERERQAVRQRSAEEDEDAYRGLERGGL